MPVEEIKNGIKYVEKPLSDQMREWKEQGKRVGILLNDELDFPEQEGSIMTADEYFQCEKRILEVGMELAYPIFITEMLLYPNGVPTEREDLMEKLSEVRVTPLDFPAVLRPLFSQDKEVYKKTTGDTKCETNDFLLGDLRESRIKKLIVMGQTRNACCGETSNYLCAQIENLEIYTSPYIARCCGLGGPSEDEPWKENFVGGPVGEYGWPIGRTTVFKSI